MVQLEGEADSGSGQGVRRFVERLAELPQQLVGLALGDDQRRAEGHSVLQVAPTADPGDISSLDTSALEPGRRVESPHERDKRSEGTDRGGPTRETVLMAATLTGCVPRVSGRSSGERAGDELYLSEIKPTSKERRRYAEEKRQRLAARGGGSRQHPGRSR